MQEVLDFLWNNSVVILGILLAISELLGSLEYFKSSSIFQLIVGLLKKLAGKS